MILKKCVNGTEQDCSKWEDEDLLKLFEKEEALEEVVWNGFKMWHLIFLSISGVMSVIILLCCCVKFRIPRTKQEIEADYIRRKIMRKFRKQLNEIQNQELDEMDLKKALDKIRAELKSDTDSLIPSEAGFSGGGVGGVGTSGSYRRASQIQIDISLEELRAQSLGPLARLSQALSRFCCGSKNSKKVEFSVDAEGEASLTVPEGTFTTTNKKGEKKENKKIKSETGKEAKNTATTDDKTNKKSKEPIKPSPTPKKGKEKEKVTAPPEKNKKDKEKATTEKEKAKEKAKPESKKDKDAKTKPQKQVAEGQSQTMEVKGQAGTSSTVKTPTQLTEDDKKKQKQKEDKKQKEKEEKDRKKVEKEKERLEKEKAKADKTKLKIENEKAQKTQKEEKKKEKVKIEDDKKKPKP